MDPPRTTAATLRTRSARYRPPAGATAIRLPPRSVCRCSPEPARSLSSLRRFLVAIVPHIPAHLQTPHDIQTHHPGGKLHLRRDLGERTLEQDVKRERLPAH